MANPLDEAVDISELGQSNLWVVYGKSGSGKTEVCASFPKPALYVQVGDDGSNTIADKEGIKALRAKNVQHLKDILTAARKDKKYATIIIDTFSLIVNEWTDENAVKKKKRMTQQMWGDMKVDQEELVKMAHLVAQDKIVVLTCHEGTDTIEGHEDEIVPDVRPTVSKGARTYLEAMANYGIHTVVLMKEKEQEDGSTVQKAVYAAHLAANPYYWVKTQKPKHIKLPKVMVNPTYDKITAKLRGE